MAEAQPAMRLGNDHAEEAVLAQVGPDLGRQVAGLVDGEIVQHGAQGGDFLVQEGLLFGAEHIGPGGQQGIKIRAARKQPSLEADGAGLEGGALRVAHHRQGPGEGLHGGLA